jgi:hypothetical protein
MIHYEPNKILSFDLKDLHKKIGQLIYMEPTDSDINEGQLTSQLWFRTEDAWYLLYEKELSAPARNGVKRRD